MLDEVFWDEPDQQTPWAQTPMFGTHEKRYAVIQEYCKKGFFLAPALWLAAVLLEVLRGIKARMYSRHCWQSNVRELLCHSGYIAMWSSTDGFWACGYLWAANASVVVTILMILASTVEQSSDGLSLQADRSDGVWILWTVQLDLDLLGAILQGLGHSALFGFTGVLCIPFAFGHELGAFPAKRGARGHCLR